MESTSTTGRSDGTAKEPEPRTALLLDHGGFWTIGDRAQTIAAVQALRRWVPGCRITLRVNPRDPYFPECGEDDTYASPRMDLERRARPVRWLQRVSAFQPLGDMVLLVQKVLTVAAVQWGAFSLRSWGWAAIPWPRTRQFLERLRSADALVISGNGGMTDVFLTGGLLPFGAEVLAARTLGKPVVLTGQGIGPFRNPLWRWFAGFFLRRADLITTREGISLDLIRQLGVTASRSWLGADDAHVYSSDRDDADRIDRFLSPLRRPFLTVNVRDERYVQTSRSFFCDLAGALDQVVEQTGATIIGLPMQTSRRDSDILRKLAAAMHYQSAVVPLPDSLLEPGTIKALQERADMAVGCTYHCLLFALSAGVPALGIYFSDYYRQKLSGLMEQYGMVDGVMPGDSVQPAVLANRMMAILGNAEGYRKAIALKNRQLLKRHRATYSRVAALLNGREGAVSEHAIPDRAGQRGGVVQCP